MPQFPSTLNVNTGLDNRFGNQFVAFYINTQSGSYSGYAPSLGAVKDPNGKVQTRGSNTAVNTWLTAGHGISDPSQRYTENSTTSDVIFLPVPMALSTNYGVEYDTFEVATEAVKLGISGGAKLIDSASDILKKISPAAGVFGNILGSDLAAQTAQFGLKYAALQTGKSLNPHKELLFKGVNFREFTFDYRLIARNADETEQIKTIINLFRKHMHPSLSTGNILFTYPSDFDIEFWTIRDGSPLINDYITFISTCVLLDVTVDYSGGGNYAVFQNTGAPVEIVLKLKFRETVVITQDLLDKIESNAKNKITVG